MAIKGKTAGGIAGIGGAILLSITLLIQPWEGRSLQAYRDIVGVWTICYGETNSVEQGDVATPAECDAMLAKSVKVYADGLAACVSGFNNLPLETKAAFISLTYNIGVKAACGSTAVRRLNAGDIVGACDAILMWNRAGGHVVQGLVNRRTAERALCREGLGLAA